MNVYELLLNELNEHKDWDIIQKLYYVYIRTCQIFFHDSRWQYNRNASNEKMIFDNEINIFNCVDRRVVCSSWSKAFCDLCNCLFACEDGYDTALTEGYSNHMFARVYTNNRVINFDPLALSNDFLRAKKHLPIRGIKVLNVKNDTDSLLDSEIETDRIINSIGYKIDDLNYLVFLREKLTDPNLSKSELFRELVKNMDYEGLSLVELNSFINIHLKKLLSKGLNEMGINVKSCSNEELIDLYFSCDGEEICRETEDKKGVKIYN